MAVVTAYTNIKPSVDTEVVIEPWFPTKHKFPFSEIPSVYEQIMARTVATWGAKDGSVKVEVANPSSEHVCAMPAGLILGSLSPATITTVVQSSSTSVSSIAASPQSPSDRASAKVDLLGPLALAFVNSTFSVARKNEIMELCAKYRPVFSLELTYGTRGF